MKTTIALILAFTIVILTVVVKKPDGEPSVAAPEAPRKVVLAQPGKSEFTSPTTIAPKEAPVVVTPVQALSSEQMQAEIETLQDYVAREDAIARLNEGSVTTEERAAWGKTFERLLELRSRKLRDSVANVQASLEALKAEHEARVAEYVGSKS